MTLCIQINGRLRATIDIPDDDSIVEIRNKALAAVQEYITRPPRRVVVVKNHLVNIII
jgi:hypothetical protein